MTWFFLLEKEFKQFFRDPGLPKMAIAFPVLMMLVFPFAVSMEIRNINLVVVDSSRSEASSLLIRTCTSSGYFNLVDICDDPAYAQRLMDRNEADAILTVNADFEKELGNGSSLPIGIKVNTVNGTKGSIGSGYLATCIRMFIAQYTGSGAEAQGQPSSLPSQTAGSAQTDQTLPSPISSVSSQPARTLLPDQSLSASMTSQTSISQQTPSIDVSPKYYYNPYMDYKVFMVPALIVIAITMLTGFFPALNIVGEKETGTIEQINVTPVRRGTFILCKLIPYWLVAFFVLTACLIIARLMFGYTCHGSLWNIYLFTALHITVMAGLGLLISNFSSNAQQAMFITWFFTMIFMLVSGIFTPIASMPGWAQAITFLNPMRYYNDAMRCVFLKGSSLTEVWYDALGLLAIGSAMVTGAILSYRKTT